MAMNTLALVLIGVPGGWELVIILVIVLIIFGPGKLPSIGKALGDSIRSFKRATSDDEIDVTPKERGQIDGGKGESADDHITRSESHSKA